MKSEHQKALKIIAIFASAVVLAYALLAIGTHVYVRAVLLPKFDANRDAIDRNQTRILADLKLLSEKPIYTEMPREKNAERFLTGFIAWEGGEPLKTLEHEHLVDFMKQHQKALTSDDEWSSMIDDETLSNLDLAWVDQLTAYDYLDLQTYPRFVERLAHVQSAHGIPRVGILATLPVPSYTELRFAALARAAQLSLEDRSREALSLYHHVGYLMSTSDSMIGSLEAVLMLENEKSLAERFEIDWTPVDTARIDAMKRTTWVWAGIERLKSVAGNLGDYEPYLERRTNACSTMLDLPGPEGLLTDYLRPTALLEPDLNDRLDRQSEVINRIYKKCGHPELAAFLAPLESPLRVGRFVPNPARIPFLRRVVGLGLATAATPNYTRYYDENPRRPASK